MISASGPVYKEFMIILIDSEILKEGVFFGAMALPEGRVSKCILWQVSVAWKNIPRTLFFIRKWIANTFKRSSDHRRGSKGLMAIEEI